jgi:hypothetical protein
MMDADFCTSQNKPIKISNSSINMDKSAAIFCHRVAGSMGQKCVLKLLFSEKLQK